KTAPARGAARPACDCPCDSQFRDGPVPRADTVRSSTRPSEPPDAGFRAARTRRRVARRFHARTAWFSNSTREGRGARPRGKAEGRGRMIQLRNVEKFYETGAGRTYVLRRVNLDVREGEFVSVMGPSGSGKTTLLSILGMLDSAFGGEYFFTDKAVHKINHKERAALHKRYIGFVFQSYHLIDSLTVRENLEVPLSYRDMRRAESEALVADTLDRFQI